MIDGVRVVEVLGRSAGGVARHVADVASGLHGRRGLSIEVAGPNDLPVRMSRPVHPVVIPDGAVRGHVKATRRLRRLFLAERFDVIHAHGLRASVDALIASRGQDSRVVATLHNLALPGSSALRTFMQRRAESFVLSRAALTLAPSTQIADYLRALRPRSASKVEVLHVAVADAPASMRTAEYVRRELGIRGDAPFAVAVARLTEQKDLPTMFEAVRRVPGCVLVVVGEGPLESELRSLAQSLGIDDRIRFTGWKDNVYEYVAAADVLCLSSVWEAVALVAQEAAAVETPIVSTDVGGIRELVEDRVSGRLVPPRDPGALASALQEVLSDPQAAAGYATRAKERLDRGFGREAMLSRLAQIYLGAGA